MKRRIKYSLLEAEEAARLCSACGTLREKRVVWLLLDTGLRLGEVAALSKGDMDFERGCLYAGADSVRRAVPLTRRIEPLLASGSKSMTRLAYPPIQRIIKDVAELAGLNDVSADVLRHTFAVRAAANGTPPLELRRLLGFKSLSAIEAYLDLAQGWAPPGPN